MAGKDTMDMVAKVLLVIGGLNWGLALFGWDVATWLSASWWGTLVKVVYALVGIAALLEVYAMATNK